MVLGRRALEAPALEESSCGGALADGGEPSPQAQRDDRDQRDVGVSELSVQPGRPRRTSLRFPRIFSRIRLLLLLCSGPALAMGLLVLARRPPPRLVVASVMILAFAAVALVEPSVLILVLQSSLLGVALWLSALAMHWAFERASHPRASGEVALIVASSSAAGSSSMIRPPSPGSDDSTAIRTRPASPSAVSTADHLVLIRAPGLHPRRVLACRTRTNDESPPRQPAGRARSRPGLRRPGGWSRRSSPRWGPRRPRSSRSASPRPRSRAGSRPVPTSTSCPTTASTRRWSQGSRERPELPPRAPRLLKARHSARWESGRLVGQTELTVEASPGVGAGLLILEPWSPALLDRGAGAKLLRATPDGRLALKVEPARPDHDCRAEVGA